MYLDEFDREGNWVLTEIVPWNFRRQSSFARRERRDLKSLKISKIPTVVHLEPKADFQLSEDARDDQLAVTIRFPLR